MYFIKENRDLRRESTDDTFLKTPFYLYIFPRFPKFNLPWSCSGRVSSTNPLPANFGTEVLFDVATKSPICCHIDFLGAGVSRRSEGRDPGQRSSGGRSLSLSWALTLHGPGPELTGARGGSDWPMREAGAGVGNGMRYEMVYTHQGSRDITRIVSIIFLMCT